MTDPPRDLVRRRFAGLAELPDSQIDLAEGAFLIDAGEYPRLDVDRWLQRLDEMATELEPRFRRSYCRRERLDRLTDYLYLDLGLRGNTEDYYDPRNSFLSDVIQRRLGIPISLGVLCMEIGGRVGIPLEGVSFPAHFLLAHAEEPDLYVDPFDGGRRLDERDCREFLFRKTSGALTFDERYLEPVSPRRILLRMLNNLKRIYLRRGDLNRALMTIDRMLLLYPDQVQEIRDRGWVHLRGGVFDRAVADFEEYLVRAPLAEDRIAVERWREQAQRNITIN